MAALNIWKGATAFLLVIVFFQFYLMISREDSIPHMVGFPARPASVTPKPVKQKDKGQWLFESERDGINVGLNSEQCDAAFPDLYQEITRAVQYWQKRERTISQDDIDIGWRQDGAIQVLICDNQLRILKTKGTYGNEGYRKRTAYVLSQLHRALLGAATAGEKVPNAEFAITVDDISLIPGKEMDTHTIWTFARRLENENEQRTWLMPDFNFFASTPVGGAWVDMQRRAALHDQHVMDKIPKAVWRGVKWTNEEVRGNLLDATAGKDWADVVEINWQNKTDVMRMDDMCRYMFVIHTEGRSWSGRLKFLLNCDSLPIVHNLDWTAEFYHLLVPEGSDQNYIPVEKNFSNLEDRVKYYLDHPQQAQRIADNAVATFRSRYTSLAAESCYWRRMIRGWSEVAFEPEPFERANVTVSGKIIEEDRLRGLSFEEWIIFQGNYPADLKVD